MNAKNIEKLLQKTQVVEDASLPNRWRIFADVVGGPSAVAPTLSECLGLYAKAVAAMENVIGGIHFINLPIDLPPGIMGVMLSLSPQNPRFDPAKHMAILREAK